MKTFTSRSLFNTKISREQRDTLFILGVLVFLLMPHYIYLPVWASCLSLTTLIWRAALSTKPAAKLPGRLIKTALAILFFALTYINFNSINGPEAGGCLLVMLTSLKTLELRAKRDALVIFYLGFFLIMLGFLQSQNIPTAIGLFIGLTLLMAALVNANMPSGTPPLKNAIKIALRLMLWGSPLMIALFITFPRLDPLWQLPNQNLARTGVSDTLTINSIGQLVQDESIAFRIKFDGKEPPMSDMYFRGPVLSIFDGETWRVREIFFESMYGNDAFNQVFQPQSPPINYEITMEVTNQPWIFTLDSTIAPPQLAGYQLQMYSAFQWFSIPPLSERIRYQGIAYINVITSPPPQQWLLADTRLPPDTNPKTQAWAVELSQNPIFAALDAKGKAQWLLDYIRTENFRYTLTPPKGYSPQNAADQLWFEYKEGFCEHYSYAFAVLMRALGIPTRIVTGYQGAEPNFVDGFWTVRQSNAHAWTEIWQDGYGWLRIDPTFAIAPERINYGSLRQNANNPIMAGLGSLSVWGQITMRWEAIENAWNQWVLGYNVTSSLDMLARLGIKSPNWFTLIKIILAFFAILFSFIFSWIFWKNKHLDSWNKTYIIIKKKLKQAGFNITDSMGPRKLAESLNEAAKNIPQLSKIQEALFQLEKIRYAPSSCSSSPEKVLKQLRKIIKNIKI